MVRGSSHNNNYNPTTICNRIVATVAHSCWVVVVAQSYCVVATVVPFKYVVHCVMFLSEEVRTM